MIKYVPIINNKGGVGKTTTTINLAAGLARRGKRVLVVDLDSQGSASLALGIDRGDLEPSSAGLLFGEVAASDVIRPSSVEGLDLISGSLRLADADTRLADMSQRHKRLLNALEPIEADYDVILMDCAPSTSLLSVNALVAADAFIIPVSPSYLSLEGVISLGEVVKNVRMGLGDAAPVLGVLLTMVNAPMASLMRCAAITAEKSLIRRFVVIRPSKRLPGQASRSLHTLLIRKAPVTMRRSSMKSMTVWNDTGPFTARCDVKPPSEPSTPPPQSRCPSRRTIPDLISLVF